MGIGKGNANVSRLTERPTKDRKKENDKDRRIKKREAAKEILKDAKIVISISDANNKGKRIHNAIRTIIKDSVTAGSDRIALTAIYNCSESSVENIVKESSDVNDQRSINSGRKKRFPEDSEVCKIIEKFYDEDPEASSTSIIREIARKTSERVDRTLIKRYRDEKFVKKKGSFYVKPTLELAIQSFCHLKGIENFEKKLKSGDSIEEDIWVCMDEAPSYYNLPGGPGLH